MSGSSQPSEAGKPDLAGGGGAADDAGAPDPAAGRGPGRLRRRLLGRRESGAAAGAEAPAAGDRVEPDPQIAEMRRDIAALWLAFNQHERTLRDLAGRLEASLGALAPPLTADPGADAAEIPGAEALADPGRVAAPISEQLSDLDDVLAAIERATEVLERTHADEIEAPGGAGTDEAAAPHAAEDEEPGGPARSAG